MSICSSVLKITVLLVFILGANELINALSDEKCRGPHEEYLTCGTACQPTCENYYEPIICNKPCVRGCFCKPGYLRNVKYKCVLPEHCFELEEPPKYECRGMNEVYTDCGTACPDTCDNYQIQIPCTRQCIPGCFCEPGYVRDEFGYCIHPKECPPTVPPKPICKKGNQTYTVCGTACPDTCDTYGKSRRCSRRCVPGCFCKKGYVKDSDNNCILPKDCPIKGPTVINQPPTCKKPNEEYLICGRACEKSCKNLNVSLTCSFDCVEGCFCRTGYVRDNRDNCIPPDYCPRVRVPTCGYLEVPVSKSRPCAGTCDEPDECEPALPGTCICKEGTVQDANGQCIYPEYCPLGCYGLNEVFDCGSPCDVECRYLGETCNIITKECVKRCYCRDGYARDHRYKCVPIKNCPRKTPKAALFYSEVKNLLR